MDLNRRLILIFLVFVQDHIFALGNNMVWFATMEIYTLLNYDFLSPHRMNPSIMPAENFLEHNFLERDL